MAIPEVRGGVAMPVGTFEYRDEAEKAAIERHIAFVQQMRDVGAVAPHGQVLHRLEGHALDAGRELLRTTLERGVQASVEQAAEKTGRTGRARAAAGGTPSGGAGGT
jgi:hypothetical protein